MLLDIREIQHVTAIGRFRNFARAAESLGISQPALSKSIRGIETGARGPALRAEPQAA